MPTRQDKGVPPHEDYAWTAGAGEYRHFPRYVNLTGNRLTVRAEEEFNGEYWEHGPSVVIDLPDEALRGLASAIEARSHDAQTQPGTDHAD